MARVYKPTYTKPIPATATPCKVGGKPAVRFKQRGGRVVTALVCEGDPTRCLIEGPKWYVEYADHAGRLQRVPGYTDKSATEALAQQLATTTARIRSGMLPPEAAAPKRTLTESLDAWRTFLVHKGGSIKHAKTQRHRAQTVCDGCGAVRPADLGPDKVLAWVDAVKKLPRSEGGLAAGTAWAFVGAIKAFTRWLYRTAKAEAHDWLSALDRETDETDPRLTRRTLSPAEFDRLLKAAHAGPVVRSLTGPERAILYLTAASTGLRASELAALTAASFDLDADTPEVVAAAAYSKNKRRDRLPIPPELLEDLRGLVAAAAHSGPRHPVWPHRSRALSQHWREHAAEMLRHDLAAAGIPYEVGGAVFDFHSLRSQFATDMDRAGVTLPRIQQAMRHSTPALTSKHYTRPDRKERAADVGRLRRQRPGATEADPAPAAPPAGGVAAELLRLAGLLEKGLLTPDEFAAAKAAVLADVKRPGA